MGDGDATPRDLAVHFMRRILKSADQHMIAPRMKHSLSALSEAVEIVQGELVGI